MLFKLNHEDYTKVLSAKSLAEVIAQAVEAIKSSKDTMFIYDTVSIGEVQSKLVVITDNAAMRYNPNLKDDSLRVWVSFDTHISHSGLFGSGYMGCLRLGEFKKLAKKIDKLKTKFDLNLISEYRFRSKLDKIYRGIRYQSDVGIIRPARRRAPQFPKEVE